MPLHWKGDQVLAKVRAAEIEGINSTMTLCVLHAKQNHGRGSHALQRYESQSGELNRNTRITDPAKRKGNATVGRWGVRGVNYARRIELGFQGQDARGAVVNSPAYPFLRPAAQSEYPKLAGLIKKALR